MRISLNNRSEELPERDRISILELFQYKRYAFPNIVVKLNGQLIKKDRYDETLIVDGDRVEMIHMVSGG